MKNKSTSIIFFNFKQHLQKAFFYEIKTDHRKWLFVVEKPDIQVILKFFQNISIWVSKSALKSSTQRSKMCECVIQDHTSGKYQGNHKIRCFPSLSGSTWIFSLFCKTMFSVEYGLKKRIFCCSYRHILRRKNTSAVACCNFFFELKNIIIVFTT